MGFNSAFKGLTFNNCTFCPHYIYMFFIYLRTNSDLCHLQHKLIGFYNRGKKWLLRGTNWVFNKSSSLRFVFKGRRETHKRAHCVQQNFALSKVKTHAFQLRIQRPQDVTNTSA